MRDSVRFLLIAPIILFIFGCKDKRSSHFTYEAVNNEKICALKPNTINEADEISMFDSSFKSMNGSFNEKISEMIYAQSLENLANKNNKYIFCVSKSELDGKFLESQIRVEIKKGKSLRQYEFINYSCLRRNLLDANDDKEEIKRSCKDNST